MSEVIDLCGPSVQRSKVKYNLAEYNLKAVAYIIASTVNNFD